MGSFAQDGAVQRQGRLAVIRGQGGFASGCFLVTLPQGLRGRLWRLRTEGCRGCGEQPQYGQGLRSGPGKGGCQLGVRVTGA